MGKTEETMARLGYELPGEVTPGGNYVPMVEVGSAGLVYTAGHVSRKLDGSLIAGRLGADLSVEQGYGAAKQTALNLLGTVKANLGTLDRVSRVVKLLCMVSCTPEFRDQSSVANGASDVLVEILGDRGRHARSAVGMAALPNNACIEIEMIVEVSS